MSQWRESGKPEDLYFEFKEGGFDEKGDVRRNDLKNLARTMSAFGNSDGGVLIFGPDRARGPGKADIMKAVTPVAAPLAEYKQRIELRVRDSTTPTIGGVNVQPLAEPGSPDRGVVAVYVPRTDAGPFRAEGPDPEVSKRYFIRSVSETEVMPHQLLAAMFGRRPFPRFRVGFSRNGDGSVKVLLHNFGPGMAVMPLLRVHVKREHERVDAKEIPGLRSQAAMYWNDRLSDILHGTDELWDVAVLLPDEFRLYPNETRFAVTIKPESFSRTVRVRVDCDNALPFEQEGRVDIGGVGDPPVWIEAPVG